MYRDLMPIGSVVVLKGGEKKLMICGRVVADDQGKIHDYVGCYYPEGVVDSSELFFFEQDAVENIYFIGFQDREEIVFRASVLAELDKGELFLEDGQIKVREEG